MYDGFSFILRNWLDSVQLAEMPFLTHCLETRYDYGTMHGVETVVLLIN